MRRCFPRRPESGRNSFPMKYPVLAALAVAVASLHAADEAKPNASAAKTEPALLTKEAPTPPPAPKVKTLTPEQVKQAWTMLGFSIASQSPMPQVNSQLELTDEEIELFLAGVRQAMRGDKPNFNPAELGEGADAMFQERVNAKAGKWGKQNDEFLAKIDADKSVTKTASGLRYKILAPGSAVKPTKESTVKCRYEGKLVDGKVFDTTKNRNNEPSEFPLSGVIPAWTEGVQLIGVGGKIVLYCPAAIAYGDQGQGPIPGKSVLEFEVELVEISKAK
ncbi:MAG: FKBP-type peptidyl-prolyl cis-trans isomerase [Verrucomicrobia bacterium]|nr:MAG: FKBP-type peptidyl-prolyl cis-trans isomerase [Verrucomicrobiota bacterium]